MAHIVSIERTGGPEVLRYHQQEVAAPAAGEIQVRQYACGLNFIDIYFRSGLYPHPLPTALGMEGAGEVVAVGAGVQDFAPGDRIAYAGRPNGAYASLRNMPAAIALKLPPEIDYATGAAMMLQGLTVQYLLRRTCPLQAGDTVLFHAAAGGVGLIACQWARALGVNLIGTAGSDEKLALAKAHGAAHVINYRTENFVERVRELTNGAGVKVVYDSIGKDTFYQSLDCLRPLGMMVSFGNASGAVPAFDLGELSKRGSLFITRPTLFAYTAQRADLEAMGAELFSMVQSGQIKIDVRQRYALADAAQAHIEMEARSTIGSSILIPEHA
ncbi:quinone oxidoreductase [Massilia sp. W12]|uniref:quinone oxidoreductase family protein n=1 Tax=Massilia sp. W12 TaxID=3126507 RepID=UPI0030D16291